MPARYTHPEWARWVGLPVDDYWPLLTHMFLHGGLAHLIGNMWSSTGTWTHDYPITFEEAQRLGLKVRSDMPPDVLQLMSLFPQPVRRQPSVEFLPVPRRAERAKPSGAAGSPT